MFFDFVKMHANGNDFVIVYTDKDTVTSFTPTTIQQWSHRHTGIGFDQLLTVQVDVKKKIDCQIFNADGSQVGQCGNGLACVGQFLYQQRYIASKVFDITTTTGVWNILILENNWVQIGLGHPIFTPECIPFHNPELSLLYPILLESSDAQAVKALQKICTNQHKLLRDVLGSAFFSSVAKKISIDAHATLFLYGGVLNLGGNPHCVLPVTDLQDIPTFLGPSIVQHTLFPKQTNVEFIQWVQPNKIVLRTYERGVGETKACGSGACAAMIISRLLKLVDTKSQVYFNSNHSMVHVEWNDAPSIVYLKTQTYCIFQGSIEM